MPQRNYPLNRGLERLVNPQHFHFATWDIEANNWWDLLIIGIWDGSEYHHFRKVGDFLDFILQTKYNGWRFFAHFGGRYDFNFIFDYIRENLLRKHIDVRFYCSGSLVIRMSLKYRSISVHLCDSYRLFYMPESNSVTKTDNKAGLRDLTNAFDVQHKKSELDFETMKYDKETLEYNENDCRGLYEVIERFFVETGVMSETFATHALRVWRKDFLRETIWKPSETILEFCRASYHGGRVEIFKRSSPGLHVYDVNSMYPYVMLSPMPVHFVGRSLRINDRYFGFVEATVYVPENYVPVLPVHLDKLYFPIGDTRGVWTTEELRRAEENGASIQKIHCGYYFETQTIFKEYVEKLYALKKTAASVAVRLIAKGLLNSLYGKFGQNPTKKIYCTERIAPAGSYPIINPDGSPSGFAYYERTSHSAYLLPHLSAAVTSKARLHLFSKLNAQTYYCDTDSVFTSTPMVTSPELGEWGSVGEGECLFIQPKLYKFKGKWKSKGLNREQSIDDFIAGSPNTIRRAKSIKEAMRDGSPACAHVVTEKYLRETRPKRAWVGEDTRPWNIRELE